MKLADGTVLMSLRVMLKISTRNLCGNQSRLELTYFKPLLRQHAQSLVSIKQLETQRVNKLKLKPLVDSMVPQRPQAWEEVLEEEEAEE